MKLSKRSILFGSSLLGVLSIIILIRLPPIILTRLSPDLADTLLYIIPHAMIVAIIIISLLTDPQSERKIKIKNSVYAAVLYYTVYWVTFLIYGLTFLWGA